MKNLESLVMKSLTKIILCKKGLLRLRSLRKNILRLRVQKLDKSCLWLKSKDFIELFQKNLIFNKILTMNNWPKLKMKWKSTKRRQNTWREQDNKKLRLKLKKMRSKIWLRVIIFKKWSNNMNKKRLLLRVKLIILKQKLKMLS